MIAATHFLRSDDPVVLIVGPAAHSCATCDHWSKWLPETGDCMRYSDLRRAAMLASASSLEEVAGFNLAWPIKSARVTSETETCSGWVHRG